MNQSRLEARTCIGRQTREMNMSKSWLVFCFHSWLVKKVVRGFFQPIKIKQRNGILSLHGSITFRTFTYKKPLRAWLCQLVTNYYPSLQAHFPDNYSQWDCNSQLMRHNYIAIPFYSSSSSDVWLPLRREGRRRGPYLTRGNGRNGPNGGNPPPHGFMGPFPSYPYLQ